MTQSVKKQIAALKESPEISELTYRKARAIYINGNCQILSRSVRGFDVLVFDEGEEDIELRITGDEDENLHCLIKGKPAAWDSFGMAALMQIDEELEKTEPRPFLEGKAYTREGMVKRVLEERRAKALKAKYTIKFADNIYGEHLLTTEKGVNYKITLRDFENETGYIDNPDLKTNKLGTTKHLMFAFAALKSQPAVYNSLSKFYPFVEIYLDPLNNYRITWHYPHHLRPEIAALITRYFGNKNYIEENSEKDFLNFIIDAREHQAYPGAPRSGRESKKGMGPGNAGIGQKGRTIRFFIVKIHLVPLSAGRCCICNFQGRGHHCR